MSLTLWRSDHATRYSRFALGRDFVHAISASPTRDQPKAAGAKLNAECVVEGIRELKDCPLREELLRDEPECSAHRAGLTTEDRESTEGMTENS